MGYWGFLGILRVGIPYHRRLCIMGCNNTKMSQKKHIHIEDSNTQKGKNHDKHKQVKPILHEGVYSTAGKVGKSQGSYIKIMNEHKPVVELRPIGLEQLSQHCSQASAWLSFKGFVYDATTYMKYHPGGKKILEGCGKECDQLFYKYHPWVNAEYLLETYKIGLLKK